MLNMIKTVLCFLYIAVSVIILLPFALFAGFFYLIGIRKFMTNIIYRIAQGWAKSLVFVTGCTVSVKGLDNIPRNSSVCFVSNHDGYFDIVLLVAYCNRPFGFIAKKELVFVPFINLWIFLLGGLFIDRVNVRKAISTINKGVRRIKAGSGMVIFPEGHRSKGRGLLPFHPGSLKLATSAGAPIVPVVIKGSYNVFEKTKRIASSHVNLTFLNPINTADLPPEHKKHILSDRIFSVINEELLKMNTVV